MRARILVPLLLVVGCAFPEPPGATDAPPERPRPDGRPGGDGPGPGPGPGPDGGGEGGEPPPPGEPGDGPDPGAPQVDGAMLCEGTPTNDDDSGKTVTVSGEVTFSELITQPVLIDLVDPKSHEQLFGQYCRGSGEFSFEAPKKLGEVVLVAFVDEAGDGPTLDDPQGRAKGTIDLDDDVTGLTIALKRGEKVDVFSPPERIPEGEPPEGEGPPEDEGPPADEDGPPVGPDGEPPSDAPGEPVESDGPQLQGE